MGRLRSYLSYSNVVSSICLFVVLGGTSYAVASGSIGSQEIKDDTVLSRDIRDGTLRGWDIHTNTLKGTQILESSLGTVPSAHSADNAGTLDGRDSSRFLGRSAKAADADKLDNKDSAAFLGANATAANADKLDNLDASAFDQRKFATKSFGASYSIGDELFTIGSIQISGICANNLAGVVDGAAITAANTSGADAKVWMLRNGTSDYVDLPAGQTMHGGDPQALVSGGPQTFTYQGVDSNGKVFSVTGTSRWDAGTCTFTAQGTVEP